MISNNTAIFLMVIVTLMWGSWFQVVKHLKDFPVNVFIAWLYFFSVIIVYSFIVWTGESSIPNGFINDVLHNKSLGLLVVFCGVMFALAIQLQLFVVHRVGLILSTSVSATCAILTGTFVSAYFGGLNPNSSLVVIIVASILLILATIICQFSGSLRDKDIGKEDKLHKVESIQAKDIFILIIANSFFLSFYAIAMSVGIKSDKHPNAFNSLTAMGLLVVGAFIGALIFSIISLKKTNNLGYLLYPLKKKNLMVFALIAASCHFGGNILQSLVVPFIGASIAIPLGNSYHMWSYLWGFVYGEYKGASLKTYLVLVMGLAFFLIGVILLSTNIS